MSHEHEANRRYWDALSPRWRELRDRDGLWTRCAAEPELAFEGEALAMIHAYGGNLMGKSACVIGTGDAYAAFALAGLGARVTATDISQGQLDVARSRAEQLDLALDFVRTDAADLAPLPDDAFDLVCSTNGLFVWIARPDQVFASVHRILKPGGFYVFYDIHPFQRPWSDEILADTGGPLRMAKPYWDTGPTVEDDESGRSYEYNWALADLLNPLAEAGLVLRRIGESPARDPRFWEGHSYEPGIDAGLMDWRRNPRAGLPVWLTVCAQKG